MVKKTGIVIAVAMAGLVATSPLAAAASSNGGNFSSGEHVDGCGPDSSCTSSSSAVGQKYEQHATND